MHESKYNKGLLVIDCGKKVKSSVDGLLEYIADFLLDKQFEASVADVKYYPVGADIKVAISKYEQGDRVIFKPSAVHTSVSARKTSLKYLDLINYKEPPRLPKESPESANIIISKKAIAAKRKATFEKNLALRKAKLNPAPFLPSDISKPVFKVPVKAPRMSEEAKETLAKVKKALSPKKALPQVVVKKPEPIKNVTPIKKVVPKTIPMVSKTSKKVLKKVTPSSNIKRGSNGQFIKKSK